MKKTTMIIKKNLLKDRLRSVDPYFYQPHRPGRLRGVAFIIARDKFYGSPSAQAVAAIDKVVQMVRIDSILDTLY